MSLTFLSRIGTLAVLACVLATASAAQPYYAVDRRSLQETPGAEHLPVRQMLDLAYQARLSVPQFDRAIARAGASGDPTLIPVLWQLARAYRATGSFTDQLFEAMRRLGETDEAFIAEAEAVAPNLPPYGPPGSLNSAGASQGEEFNGVLIYLKNLVYAAAARADSAFLPRVLALDAAAHPWGVSSRYVQSLRHQVEIRALPMPEQFRQLVYNAGRAYVPATPFPGQVRSSHEFSGVLPFGPGLDPMVVWSRERLAALYATDPAAVEAGIAERVQQEAARSAGGEGSDAERLRAYLLSAVAQPPPVPRATDQ